jgi:hypothetical protein
MQTFRLGFLSNSLAAQTQITANSTLRTQVARQGKKNARELNIID